MLLGPPETVGRYTVRDEIGAGGFATVFRAHDPVLDREVALKLLHRHLARDPAIRARFVREGRALARIRHANVVQVHDAGEIDGLAYLAMELVEGESLAALLRRRGRLSLWETAQVVEQAAAGLTALHDHDLLHLDVKPPNILLEHGTARVVLLDLGVARGIEETIGLTGDASFGTPAYMAPEQFVAGGRLAPATDVYQLGATAFVLLTGTPPFPGSPAEVMEAVLHAAPPDPSAAVPGLSRTLGALVQRAMAKEPAARPRSPAEFAGDFRDMAGAGWASAGESLFGSATSAVGATEPAAAPSATERLTAPATRRPRPQPDTRIGRPLLPALLAGAAILAVLAVLAGVLSSRGSGSDGERATRQPSLVTAADRATQSAAPTAAPTRAPTPSTAPTPSAAPTPAPSPPVAQNVPASPAAPAEGDAGELLAATMASRGFAPAGAVVRVSTDSGDTLSVQKGVCSTAPDGLCQMLFIALNDRFLGTDWPEPSLLILDVRPAGVDRFAAEYGQYRAGDVACCPRGEPVTVTFTWNGSRLRPDRVAPGQCRNGC